MARKKLCAMCKCTNVLGEWYRDRYSNRQMCGTCYDQLGGVRKCVRCRTFQKKLNSRGACIKCYVMCKTIIVGTFVDRLPNGRIDIKSITN